MAVEVVIGILAAALAAVTVVAAVIGLLGVSGVAVFNRCEGCDRLMIRRRSRGAAASDCTRCRHPHLTHPVHSVRHPHSLVPHH